MISVTCIYGYANVCNYELLSETRGGGSWWEGGGGVLEDTVSPAKALRGVGDRETVKCKQKCYAADLFSMACLGEGVEDGLSEKRS